MSQQLRFTPEQKEAVIYSLYQISRSDSHLDESELDFLTRVGDLLGEVFDHLSISRLMVKNSPKHLSELMTFNSVQQEWFVVAVYAMINCDNKLFDEEFTVAQGFFNVMGISSEKAVRIIKKLDNEVRFF